MSLHFYVGPGPTGKLCVRRIPVYAMPHWRVVHQEPGRIEYAPSARTVAHTLRWSGLAALILAALAWSEGIPWSTREGNGANRRPSPPLAATTPDAELQAIMGDIEGRLPAQKVADLQRQHRERLEALAAEPPVMGRVMSAMAAAGRLMLLGAFVAMGAIAILPLAALPLQKVVIERTPDAGLSIRKRGLWPSTRRYERGRLRKLAFGAAKESISRRRFTRVIRYDFAWRWGVKLHAATMTIRDGSLSLGVSLPIVFYIDRQRRRPDPSQPAPATVRTLVAQLAALTGAEVDPRPHIERASP